jgi:hypothetical protein
MSKGNAKERHPAAAGVPLGSPVAPIHFAMHATGLIKLVEEYVKEAAGLSCYTTPAG